MLHFIRWNVVLSKLCLTFTSFHFSLWTNSPLPDLKWAFGSWLTQTQTACLHPHLYTHTRGNVRRRGGGQRKQTQNLEHALFVLASGHKETTWPQHFKLSIWGSLMCIDSYCTKGTKTIIGCLVCLNSSPKIPWYVQWSNLCLQSVWSHSVCEIYTNKTIVFLGNQPSVFPMCFVQGDTWKQTICGSIEEKQKLV